MLLLTTGRVLRSDVCIPPTHPRIELITVATDRRAMQTLLQNLRFSLRMLWKSPGLTLTILLTLALGIGANTAIFTVDYATLLAPLPYPEPNQLVMVWSKIKTFHNGVSAGDFTDWKQQNTSFSTLSAFTNGSFNIASKDEPEFLQASITTPGMLQ